MYPVDIFADNVTIHSNNPSMKCVENVLISIFVNWCSEIEIVLNVEKTNTMHMGTQQRK